MSRSIREPKLVRVPEDDVSGTRVAIVLVALFLIGGLMYFNKDQVPAVADLPSGTTSMSHPSTTGAAPTR